MATLNARLQALENIANTAPMLTMEVDGKPTTEQSALIDRCIKSGRRLFVFCMPHDDAWLAGNGSPPWEVAL